jgi:putative two-component system response regulator
MQKTIFIVDDNDTNLMVASVALEKEYRVMTLPSAAKMFKLLEKMKPDLILLDIEMPEMDGFEAIKELKKHILYKDIPVIFLTSLSDVSVEIRGFQFGVIDFITKPFSAPVLTNRINTHLNIDGLIRERTIQLQQKTEQLQHLQHAIIYGLADMVESRDVMTGGHIDRTATYAEILIDAMTERGVYVDEIEKLDKELLISSTRLHDIGKIAIPDLILNKPGRLTVEEYEIMKTHVIEGERIIDKIASRTHETELLSNAKLFVSTHHERWDGTGYPHGLAGDNIPFQGRLMAIVDVYDALVSERPYKKALPPEEAVKIIMENSGTHFDPEVADVFYEVRKQFTEVKPYH